MHLLISTHIVRIHYIVHAVDTSKRNATIDIFH